MNDFVQNMMAYLEQYHQRSNSKVSFALSEPKKWHKKKWIKYEREHSNSLWHVDLKLVPEKYLMEVHIRKSCNIALNNIE
jgi:hypothetical protein